MSIKKELSIRKFTTADLHLGHGKIRNYESLRAKFSSVEEMDNYLIKRWNSVVSPIDHVYLLGDVSFHDDEKTKELIDQMNGVKHLILGNHDKDRSWPKWIKCGFASVQSELILQAAKDLRLKFSHYPYVGDNANEGRFLDKRPVKQEGTWLVHGHMHSKGSKFDEKNEQICVSGELWDFKPVNIDNILASIRKFKQKSSVT